MMPMSQRLCYLVLAVIQIFILFDLPTEAQTNRRHTTDLQRPNPDRATPQTLQQRPRPNLPARLQNRPASRNTPSSRQSVPPTSYLSIPQQKPYLTNVNPNCLGPKTILTFTGSSLTLLRHYHVFLTDQTEIYRLKPLSQNQRQALFQPPSRLFKDITNSPGDGEKRFQIILSQQDPPLQADKSDLEIPLCSDTNLAMTVKGKKREILIYGAASQKQKMVQALQQLSLPLIDSYDLPFLKSLVLQSEISDPDHINNLRKMLPASQIDYNISLSPLAGPRYYARNMLKWPQNCPNLSAKIPVGLIDGQIDMSHPAFQQAKITSKNFISQGEADLDHATAIAGILLGQDSKISFQGLDPKMPLYSAVVLTRKGNQQRADILSLLRGVDWILSRQIRLINLSLAGQPNRVLTSALHTTAQQGGLIFAAAGNLGPKAGPAYPASLPFTFAITALDAAQQIYQHANQGDYIDFAAPGVDIWVPTQKSKLPNIRGKYVSGTSFAVPYAVATSRLYLYRNPALSQKILTKILGATSLDLGQPGKDQQFGAGLIQSHCPTL